MIRYALTCRNGHGFESWFADSASFDLQIGRGLVACPFCNTVKVEKAVMAPSIARRDRIARNDQGPAAEPAETAQALPPAAGAPTLFDAKAEAKRAALKALHDHLAANAENLGHGFAQEALRIHNGEASERPIYGKATSEDARMLVDEGVAFGLLPALPGEHN